MMQNVKNPASLIFINKQTFVLLGWLGLFLIGGCRTNSNKDITAVIDSFYGKQAIGDYHLVNKNLLSSSLQSLLEKAAIIQSADSARLKAAGSKDKPLMLEGDIFTSVLEGSTAHQQEALLVNGDTCRVTLQFTNAQYGKYLWYDTVLLVKEAQVWKIDDVLYQKGKGAGKSIRDVLTRFIQSATTSQSVDSVEKVISAPASQVTLRTGNHAITIQWIGWEKPGSAILSQVADGQYHIEGKQNGQTPDEYLRITGTVYPIADTLLHFDGTIESTISIVNAGKPCVRKGKYTFVSKAGKKYWRLQEMDNCEGGMVKDYIDIYF